MRTLIGNLFGIVFVTVPALMGFISLEASVISFVVIAYGYWLIILSISFFLTSGELVQELRGQISDAELRAFRRHYVHIVTPGAGEVISGLLNFLRLVGFIWAGLALWGGNYILGGLCIAFYFVSGGIIFRTNPLPYMAHLAQQGNDIAVAEWDALQSLKEKLNLYKASRSRPNPKP